MIEQTDRIHGLEGMRGVAAFWVFTHHYLLIFYPHFYFGPHTWINHILNPDLAVAWFFVHSGFVLSLKTERKQLLSQASRRYLRLLPPVLLSIFVTYLLLKSDLIFNKEYASTLNNEWLGRYLNFSPDIRQVFYQSFWGSYFDFHSGSTYNPNLWTIGYELIASYILFMTLACLPRWRRSFWLLLPLAFIIGPWKGLMAFFLGAFLTRIYQYRVPQLLIWLITVLGFCLSDLKGDLREIALSLSAALLMFTLLKSTKLRAILETRFFKRLGELSYSLYVLHFALLASFTSFVGMKFEVHNSTILVILLYLATTFILWVISELAERFVDRPGVKLSKFISQKIVK
jgi:peptidoglycan/LPS O-acetylase OafA/YrhL